MVTGGGVEELRNRGTEESRNRGIEELRNRGIEELRNRGIEELRIRGRPFSDQRINNIVKTRTGQTDYREFGGQGFDFFGEGSVYHNDEIQEINA